MFYYKRGVMKLKFFILWMCLNVYGMAFGAESAAQTSDVNQTHFFEAHQILQNQLKLKDELIKKFTRYTEAQDNLMLFLCTKKLASYQNIQLSAGFKNQEEMISSNLIESKKDFYESINSIKKITDKSTSEKINNVIKLDQSIYLPNYEE